MQFMLVYYPGPEGLTLNVPLRWQHGPTPGVKLVAAWVTTTPAGDTADRLADGRTYMVIETETLQGLSGFVNWMAPFTRKIEVRPVTDYLPQNRAYEARDPDQWPFAPTVPAEQQAEMKATWRRYIAASSPAEALAIWRDLPQRAGGGKDVLDALRIRQELG